MQRFLIIEGNKVKSVLQTILHGCINFLKFIATLRKSRYSL